MRIAKLSDRLLSVIGKNSRVIPRAHDEESGMLIDCDTCIIRGHGCRDCVVTVILNNPAQTVDFDEAEEVAVSALSEAGLVPPLRLVPVLPDPERGIA